MSSLNGVRCYSAFAFSQMCTGRGEDGKSTFQATT